MFLDIALGIFSSIFVSHIFGISLSTQFVILGIIFNLLPDMDALLVFTKKGWETDATHRDLFHFPLVYIPIGFLILSHFSQEATALFVLSSLFHFIHDSIGIGWGVERLFPFNRNHFAFFYVYSPNEMKLPWKLMYIWPHKQIGKMMEEYGDKKWIQNIYFKFHPYALFEYGSFVLALFIFFLLQYGHV